MFLHAMDPSASNQRTLVDEGVVEVKPMLARQIKYAAQPSGRRTLEYITT